MFFLSDVEHILDVLEFCILVDFRILQEIILHVNTLFLYESTENVAFFEVLPCFFCMHWNIFTTYGK